MDKQVFVEGLVLLQSRFGEIADNEKVAKVMRKNYAVDLKDIPNKDFIRGVKNTIDNYQYNSFPKSSDIRKFCGFDIESKARMAIAELKRVARKTGSFDSVSFGDPVLHMVSESTDKWAHICHWDEKQWGFNYSKMVEMYKSMAMAGRGLDHIKGYGERTKSIYDIKRVDLPWSNFQQLEYKEEKRRQITSKPESIKNILEREL